MKRIAQAVLIVVAGLQLGCPHDRYEITMTVDRDVIVREIDATSQPAASPPTPSHDVQTIAAAYNAKPEGTHYSGRFVGKTPNDVGGSGRLGYYPSQLGQAWLYIERFRGDTDPAATITERLKSAELLADLLAGWAETRYKQYDDYPVLAKYLEGDFKKDLRNLSLYFWLAGHQRGLFRLPSEGTAENVSGEDEISRRCKVWAATDQAVDVAAGVQYLVENGYLDVKDVPVYLRMTGSNSGGGPVEPQFGNLLRGALARRAGLKDGKLLDALAAIPVDHEKFDESFTAYVETTPQFKQYLASQPATTPASKPESSLDLDGEGVPRPRPVNNYLDEMIGKAFAMHFDGSESDDELYVSLKTDVEPVVTNGQWDATTSKIHWSRRLLSRNATGTQLPDVFWACWAKPDEEAQKKHFGKVLLTGRDLLAYCVWRNSLSQPEAADWDKFLAAYRPEDLEKTREQLNVPRIGTTTRPADSDYVDFLRGMLEQKIMKSASQPASQPSP